MTTGSLIVRIAEEANLQSAWHKVRENRGAAGLDRVTIARFAEGVDQHLQQLQASLLDDTYYPKDLRRVQIPKPDGGERALAIPTVLDRVAQRAFVNVLEPQLEQIFLECSYAYRPHRGVAQAVEAILAHRTEGFGWILDADVERFFDTLDHALLMERLQYFVSDRAVLRNIQIWLDQGILEENRSRLNRKTLLQETVAYAREVSQEVLDDFFQRSPVERLRFSSPPLLPGTDGEPMEEPTEEEWEWERRRRELVRFGRDAALLLVTFRRAWLPLLRSRLALVGGGVGLAALGAGYVAQHLRERESKRRLQVGAPQGSPLSPLLANLYLHNFDTELTRRSLRLVRYADNFVVCCASENRALQAREMARMELARLRLNLNSEKTRVVDCADDFVFLGYEFDREGAFPLPPRKQRRKG